MAIIVINPNSTVSMTEAAVATIRAAVPGRVVQGWTSMNGPPSIQGEADGMAAVPPLLDLVRQADAEDAEAIIIACFDDTGLDEARALARCPVLGIGQAAYTMATLRGHPYAVVTTLAVSVPILEANIRNGGFSALCRRVSASGIAVLELESDSSAPTRLLHAIDREKDFGAKTIVLGCAGMTGLLDSLRMETGVSVIDGVQAGGLICDALLRGS